MSHQGCSLRPGDAAYWVWFDELPAQTVWLRLLCAADATDR